MLGFWGFGVLGFWMPELMQFILVKMQQLARGFT